MKRLLMCCIALTLTACNERKPPPPVMQGVSATVTRFTVQSHGEFYGGYANNRREIFVVTDTQTGVEYLAITGCGTTEMRSTSSFNGKTTVSRTVEE